MSSAPKKRLTVADYLAIERHAAVKSEFVNGEMFAMAGASREHNRIKENLIGELFNRLKGGPCRTYSSDQRILVEATGLCAYPDLVIVCGSEVVDFNDPDTLTNPTGIVEVISPSTEKYDRGSKFRHCQQIPTLTEYILVSQDEPVCERFIRQADGSWALVSFVGLTSTLAFTSLSASIPLADVYAGVAFSDHHE
jgi:Uma2 family endonuclease